MRANSCSSRQQNSDFLPSPILNPPINRSEHLAAPSFAGCRLRVRCRWAAVARPCARLACARERDRLAAVRVDAVVSRPVPDLVEMTRETGPHKHVQRVSADGEHSPGVHGVVVVESERLRGGLHRPLVDHRLAVVFAVPLELRQLEEAVRRRKETDVSNLPRAC